MTTQLTTQICLNPFFIDDYQIKKIVFFNESGVLFETRSGWFGNNNNFREGLNIPETVKKLKVDTTRKFCFFTPVKGEYYEKGKYCELYLYIDGEQIKLVDLYESKEEMTKFETWKYENIKVDICGHLVKESRVLEIKKTRLGEYVDEMSEQLEQDGIKINSYDLRRLLSKYELIRKGGKNDRFNRCNK